MAIRASVNVEVKGARRIVRNAERAGGRIKSAVERVIRQYTLKVERTAKRLAPVDTGRLRASIHHRLQGMAAEVLTNVEYAPFQEFGTGRLGAASGIEPPPEYVYGTGPGMSPNSFLRPALERHRKAFVQALRNAVKNAL